MKKINLKLILLILVILVLSFSLGKFCAYHSECRVKKNAGLTNPLLRYMKFKELRSFRGKLGELIEKEKKEGLADEVAVYFRSLTVGIWIGINERGAFCPASILKVPVMMTYFKMAEKDPDILEKEIEYKPQYFGGYIPGLTQNSSAETGKYYSVDELIKFMIVESDNNADFLLLSNLPPGALAKTFWDFGMDLSRLSPEEDFVSLKTIATFLRVLYNSSYLNEKMSEKALRYLTECKYLDGIVAGLPKNIVVAHKFGERFFEKTNKKELHEVAIIYYPDNPYILAIMTRGDDYSKLAGVIKDISGLIYQEIDSQYKNVRKGDVVEVE